VHSSCVHADRHVMMVVEGPIKGSSMAGQDPSLDQSDYEAKACVKLMPLSALEVVESHKCRPIERR